MIDEAKAKETLDFLAKKCGYYCAHINNVNDDISLARPVLCNFMLLDSMPLTDDIVSRKSRCLYVYDEKCHFSYIDYHFSYIDYHFIKCKPYSYSGWLNVLFKICKTYDIWVASSTNNFDEVAFLSKGTSLEEILIEIDLANSTFYVY